MKTTDFINENVSYKVYGYSNRWSVIDRIDDYALLENETWGDETCLLVVNVKAPVVDKLYKTRDGKMIRIPTIMEVLDETYDDLQTALEDLCIL